MEIEPRRRTRRSNPDAACDTTPTSATKNKLLEKLLNEASEFASKKPSKPSSTESEEQSKKPAVASKKTPEPAKNRLPAVKTPSATPKKRGRPSKGSPSAKKPTPTATTQRSIKDYLGESSPESVSEESGDDFRPETSSASSSQSNSVVSDLSEGADTNVAAKRPGKKRQVLAKLKVAEETARAVVQLDKFELDKVVEEWEYETDADSRVFRKPLIPLLSDKAIAQFVSKDSKPPKCVIYSCPFCQRVYTYNLVFKNHLFTCEKNTCVPKYLLLCVETACAFTGTKRQEMVNHFFEMHHHDGNQANDTCLVETDFQRTKTKQSQLEVSRYCYIDRAEFQFTFDYFNKSIAVNYKRLKYLTDFYLDQGQTPYERFVISTTESPSDPRIFKFTATPSMTLKFQLPNEKGPTQTVQLKPFEIYQSSDQAGPFKLINAADQVSVLDWCPTKLRNLHTKSQYLAFATCPSQQIIRFFSPDKTASHLLQNNHIKNLFESPNLIYFFLNRKLGHVNSLKWRPDCGASISDSFDTPTATFDSTFIGYLLATSSNGNGYVTCVQDMTKLDNHLATNTVRDCGEGTVTSVANLGVYEFRRQIILKTRCAYGQCTSSDWSQLNGGTEIALGYANGTVAIFRVNSGTLRDQLKAYGKTGGNDLVIYPVRTFSAHQSFVRVLRWSKLKSSLLASGSTFSRDVKCWDTDLPRAFIEYEIFTCEMAFSLHSNCLFIAKEANLKGENHLYELDVSFNVFNKERDETRSHSSLFATDGTMTSMDQSDYFNKFLVCDSRGSVIVSSASNPKFWTAKNQLMFNSFSRVCKFDVLNVASGVVNKKNDFEYQFDAEYKSTRVIQINLDRKKLSKKNGPDNSVNPNQVDLNNLTAIRWNMNFSYLNWYAVGSQSGFLFLQRLDELAHSLDE